MESLLARALAVSFDELRARTLDPVEVVVIDSGVDATHPDLASRVVAAFRVETPAGGKSPEVVPVPPNTNNDTFGHGTAVASIICRSAPNARIIDMRVIGPGNAGAGGALVAGLRHALRLPAPLYNMSLAATAEFAPKLAALCETAYRRGKVIVAAKRNMPLVDNGFPAELSSVISVDRARFADPWKVHYRDSDPIEYVGHGEDITVAAPGGGYTTKTGTSFATPAISGLCALLLGAFPGLRLFDVKAVLRARSSSEFTDNRE